MDTGYCAKNADPMSASIHGRSQLVGIGTTLAEHMACGPTKRVEGMIKYVPEDFFVNEIEANGDVVVSKKTVERHVAAQAIEHERNRTSGELFLKLRKVGSKLAALEHPLTMFTKDDCTRFDAFLDNLVLHMKKDDAPEISKKKPPFCLLTLCDTDDAKALRTKVHIFIREMLPFLDSTAIALNEVLKKAEGAEYVDKFMNGDETLDTNKVVIKVFPRPTCIAAIHAARNGQDDGTQDVMNMQASSEMPSLASVVKHLDVTDYSEFPQNFKERQKMKQYLHFSINKRDRSTHEVTHMLCRALHRSSHDVYSAGNKDRRAVTTQRFCVRRAKIEDFVLAMSQGHWFDEVLAGDFKYSSHRLRLGNLRGNSFWVAIRGVEDMESAINSLESLKQNGFLNYFGLQRFGSIDMGTHMIGAAMIRRDYEDAVRLIIKNDDIMERYLARRRTVGPQVFPTEPASDAGGTKRHCTANGINSHEETTSIAHINSEADARHEDKVDQLAVTEDDNTEISDNEIPTEAEETGFPRHRKSFIERELIRGMMKDKTIEDVLRCIPTNVLSIYVHATQSLVFNYALTERITKYGIKPVPGDFAIRAPEFHSKKQCNDDDHSSEDGEEPMDDYYDPLGQQVSVVKEEDDHWSIYDIVLPLPGDNVEYPEFLKPIYEKVVKEHFNLSLDTFATLIKGLPAHQKGRERCMVGVGGGYRHIVSRAHGLQYYVVPNSYQVSEYSNVFPPRFMQLRQVDTYVPDGSMPQREGGDQNELPLLRGSNDDHIRGKTLAVNCSLPKSCYLTCALREVLTDQSLERYHIA
ncbi:hypothetical protein BgAZ_500350 [Babesia gibsoni]|uniref:TRUD domain-containing protein n=1 Tax=Babesia gibsoni TaxID=33632 RepID=A0AAD8LHY8_BABGI|nr:hypothetical protein BgAZ_500350 [Babesia gibsoni]